jgi:hypothetical protein
MPREVRHLQINGIWIDCSVRESHSLQGTCTKHNVEEGADVTDHVRVMPDSLQLEGIVTNTPLEQPGSHTSGAVWEDAPVFPTYYTGERTERSVQVGTVSQPFEGEPALGFFTILPILGDVLTVTRNVPKGAGIVPNRKFNAIGPAMGWVQDPVGGIAGRLSRDVQRAPTVADALRATFLARKPIQVITAFRNYENCVITDLQIERDASRGANLFFAATCEVIRLVKSQTGLAGAPKPAQVRGKPALNQGTQNTQPVAPTEVPQGTKDAAGSAVGNLFSPPTPGQ